MTNPALTGIKIADFSRVLAGPYATMLLADLGAQVTKVERPGSGDETRSWGPPFDENGRATYFQSVNRNKSSILLDLDNTQDLSSARQLILESDIVVENFGPGGMKRFGLDFETLSKEKPSLIYCSITGFGDSERAKSLPGYDMLIQGMSGLMSITGEPSVGGTKVGVALIDVIAGLHATTGILTALHARNESGLGQEVEINLFSSALSALVNQSGAFAAAGVVAKALGNDHPSIVPYGVFHSADRDFIIAVGNDHQFQALEDAIGLEKDDRFATNQLRVKNREELVTRLNEIFATKPSHYWIEKLSAVKIPAGPINRIDEAFLLADHLGLNPIIDIDGAKSVANPIHLSRSPISYRLPPPDLK